MNEANRNAISAEGLAQAEEELRQRREERRSEIVDSIKSARELGDLSENAEYHAAREAQGLNEARIRALEARIADAEVQEPPAGGEIGVGSRVSFREAQDGELTEVTIVNPLEASVPDGKVSVESPIASALLGSRAGDTVTMSSPRGERQLEVVAVG